MKSFPASRSDRLTLGLVVGATLLWVAFPPGTHQVLDLRLSVVLLGAAFLVVEWYPLTLEYRGQSFHMTLSGLVILLGVVFAGPLVTLVVRVITGAFSWSVRWRSPAEKVRFNVVLYAIEVWLAAAVFSAVLGSATLTSMRASGAIVATLATTEVVTSALVLLVICLTVGKLRMDALKSMGVCIAATGAISASSSVVAVHLFQTQGAGLVGFIGVLGLLVASNRSRHHLSEKHRAVTALYGFMEHIQGVSSLDELLQRLLSEACEVTGAHRASLLLLMGDNAWHFNDLGDGLIAADERPREAAAGWVKRVGQQGLLLREGQGGPAPALRTDLTQESLLAAFSQGELEGLLIIEGRRGNMPHYDTDDLALTVALARHAGVAVATSRLLDELRTRTHELEVSALHDPQTGLLNVDGILAREPVLLTGGVVVVDLPDVEMIDTAFGHGLSGDIARSTARRLRQLADQRGFTACRLATGRFGLILHGVTEHLDVRHEARELADLLGGPIAEGHLQLEARVAMGASVAPDHGTDVGELLRKATNALVEADGSLELSWYAPELDAAATDRLELASDLRSAIEEDGLSLAFQPKVDLGTGRIVGVEALARWAHPTRGYVPPSLFIDIAERTGLIRPLTLWVVEQALSQAAAWHNAGHPLTMAINMSTVVLEEESLARRLIDGAAALEVPARSVILEITESQIMDNLERSTGILAMFDAAGMQVSIDDFGTGYSSLAQLKALPVDEVKIDRGFVTNLAVDADDRAITEAILRMARSLGLHVVAEGIEDQRALEILRSMGCDTAQGYFLHRPMTAFDVTALLDAPEAESQEARVLRLRGR